MIRPQEDSKTLPTADPSFCVWLPEICLSLYCGLFTVCPLVGVICRGPGQAGLAACIALFTGQICIKLGLNKAGRAGCSQACLEVNWPIQTLRSEHRPRPGPGSRTISWRSDAPRHTGDDAGPCTEEAAWLALPALPASGMLLATRLPRSQASQPGIAGAWLQDCQIREGGASQPSGEAGKGVGKTKV